MVFRQSHAIPSQKVRWHLGHLDALRGIAILGVVLVHSALAVLHDWRRFGLFWDICFAGQRGVQLFFIVSAFTLFLSLRNRKEELPPTRNFFLRRIFRIVPLFYLAIGLTYLLLRPAAGPPLDIALSALFLNGFYWRSIFHGAAGGWSLANEAMFYALLPLLYRWIRSLRASLYVLLIAMPVCFVCMHLGAHFSTFEPMKEFYMFLSFIAELPVFLMGIVAFYFWETFRLHEPAETDNRKLLSAFLLIFIALALLAEMPSDNPKLWPSSMLGATLLLALSLHPWRFLVNRVTIYLGKISFSIYLLHFFLIGRVFDWVVGHGGAPLLARWSSLGTILIFLLTLAVTCPLATLTWLWIEEPGIRLGRRLITHLEHQAKRVDTLVPPLEAVVSVNNSPDAQF